MHKLLSSEHDLPWIEGRNVVKTYLSDTLPPVKLCASAYAIVLKNKALLQTELREGERPTKLLDIPGGHIDLGESPEDTVVRETFEETGVRVKVDRLVGYMEVTITSKKSENYRYPYPTSYMLFYFCEVVEETQFDGNDETHGKVWLSPVDFDKSEWCRKKKILLETVLQTL